MRVRDPRLILLLSAAMLGAAVAFPLGVIASHQFSDVPTSSTFHADIDAIRDAGVTTGCAPNLYCPKDFVTREQMAAFLNRLGALGPGKTPVANADKVDGRDASDLTYVIDNAQINLVPISAEWSVYEQATIDAPTDGFVLVVGSLSIQNSSCTQDCIVFAAIEHTGVEVSDTDYQQLVDAGVADAAVYATMSLTRVIAVEAGSNTFQVRLRTWDFSNGSMSQTRGQISAIFSPFGETHS